MKQIVENKRVLGLELPTDPRWVNLAEMDLEEILTDHAYCEMKAASTCISLIQLYPHKTELVAEVAPVVTEEWGHFRQVLAEMNKRGLQLGNQRKDEYVNKLLRFIKQRKTGNFEKDLCDRLLMCALIEARSCERFRLLSEGISEVELREFYYKFMVSEAGHYKMFLQLAKLYFEESLVNKKWKEWLDFEAEMLPTLTVRGDRMH